MTDVTITKVLTRPSLDVSFVDFSNAQFNEYREKYSNVIKDEHITFSVDGLTRTSVLILTPENAAIFNALTAEYAAVWHKNLTDRMAGGIELVVTGIDAQAI